MATRNVITLQNLTRPLGAALALSSLGFTAGAASAQHALVAVSQQAAAPLDVFVSVDVKRSDLLTVMGLLMKQAHANYTVDSRLQDASIGAVRLTHVPLSVALHTVIRASNIPATYLVDSGVIMIVPQEPDRPEPAVPVQPAAAPAQLAVVYLDLDFNNASLNRMLKILATKYKIDIVVQGDLESARVTMRATHQSLDAALQSMQRGSSIPWTYSIQNGTYYIKPAPPAAK